MNNTTEIYVKEMQEGKPLLVKDFLNILKNCNTESPLFFETSEGELFASEKTSSGYKVVIGKK